MKKWSVISSPQIDYFPLSAAFIAVVCGVIPLQIINYQNKV